MAGENFNIYFSQMFSLAQPRATNKNPNFQNLCELEKNWKYSLGSKFANGNFCKSMDHLGRIMSYFKS